MPSSREAKRRMLKTRKLSPLGNNMDWTRRKNHFAEFSRLRVIGIFRDNEQISKIAGGLGRSETLHPLPRFHVNITDIALLDICILQLRDVELGGLHPVDEREPVLLWRLLELNRSERGNEKKCDRNGSKSRQASFVPILHM